MNKKKYLDALKKADITVSSYAKDLINKIEFQKKEKVNLVRLSVADLGLTVAPMWSEILDAAKKKGYEHCSPEDALALGLEHKNQSRDDWFWVGMLPITDSGGYPRVFCVERDGGGGRWLGADFAHPADRWDLSREIAFRLRKSSALKTLEPIESSDTLDFENRIASLESDMEKIRKILILK